MSKPVKVLRLLVAVAIGLLIFLLLHQCAYWSTEVRLPWWVLVLIEGGMFVVFYFGFRWR